MKTANAKQEKKAKNAPIRRARCKYDLQYRWSNFKSQSRRRQIRVTITLMDYFAIILKPCEYCGDRHYSSSLNGVDRVDSNGSYSIENSVPCCKTCNFMKGSMKKWEFLAQVNAIRDHVKLKGR